MTCGQQPSISHFKLLRMKQQKMVAIFSDVTEFKCLGPVNEFVGSVVEWLKRRARDQHGLGSKPTRTILLCPWERHFTAHSPVWWP